MEPRRGRGDEPAPRVDGNARARGGGGLPPVRARRRRLRSLRALPAARPTRRRRHLARALVLILAAGIVFAVGVAFGQALRDQPQRSERTEVRTLRARTVVA